MTEKKDAEKKDTGFTIKDSRSFSPTGKRKDKEKKDGGPKKKAGVEDKEDNQEKPIEKKAEDIPLPEVNFSNFIFSLSSSAIFHLGEFPDPVYQKKEMNLPLANHTIDTIGMIKEKTGGNLSRDEETMIDNILYDLRMLYVKKLKE